MERSRGNRHVRGVLRPPESAATLGADLEAEVELGIEALPDAPALLSTPDGVVVRATAQAANLVGYESAAALTGRGLSDLLLMEGDFARLRQDEDESWYRVMSWRHQANSRLTVTLLVDVSDLMTPTVRGLAEERRKLQDAQRAARLGTWEWDPLTNNIRLSEMLFEITGTPPGAETTFGFYLDHIHPEDRNWVERAWQHLAATHEPVQVEHRYIRPDGAMRILSCHGTAISDANGRQLLVGTAQDVTEPRTAVTRMERSSQRFSDLVSITPVGIGLFDEYERLVDANDALCELLGHQLEQLRGTTAGGLAHPDDVVNLAEQYEQRSEQGSRGEPSQRMLVCADGRTVHCELHTAPSVQDDGSRFWLVVFQDVTERRRNIEALRFQATHDELTGLPNRVAVKNLLATLLSGETAASLAVLFCDIDNFKRINDSLGHDAGDEVLVALARRLEGGLPDGCHAARISGDEFVIICSDVDAVGGLDSLATRVSSLLRTSVPVHGQLVRVSASIGASVPSGTDIDGADLLRFADAAMFEAKNNGGGRVSLAGPALMASADRQLQLEGQLRDALNQDQLVLHYQPVVDADGAVVCAEALLRWPHPERGLLAPGDFLPVAEQGGLLRDIDRWVLHTALGDAARWPPHHGKQVSVAINLSGFVPGDHDFVDYIADCVAEHGIAWNRVVLELVETALVDLPTRTRQAMEELTERGASFAVDDFGTGFSSLARLKDVPTRIIKVDRRFVSGIDDDSSDLAVVRAVVDLARAMGRECVAEGVETPRQFRTLSGMGIDAYQGWAFSAAIPAAELRTVLSLGALNLPRPD